MTKVAEIYCLYLSSSPRQHFAGVELLTKYQLQLVIPLFNHEPFPNPALACKRTNLFQFEPRDTAPLGQELIMRRLRPCPQLTDWSHSTMLVSLWINFSYVIIFLDDADPNLQTHFHEQGVPPSYCFGDFFKYAFQHADFRDKRVRN